MSTLRLLAVCLVGAMLFGNTPAADVPASDMKLCGWFVNPTPGNAWLVDRSGEWLVSTQGGEEAEGEWPEFAAAQWAETNGHHGYGCACMQVTAVKATRQIVAIKSAHAQSLSVCQKDRSLKMPP